MIEALPLQTLSPDELWVIATCAVCAAACAIPGVFLILSRSSLLADGIAHSALAGVGVAFLITGSRSPLPMLVGAFIAGLCTTWLSTAISKTSVIKPDAALGVVFTLLFSIGVIIITIVAREVDLDPGCILYGLPEFIPFDTVQVLGATVPRSFAWLLGLLLTNTALACFFWKELTISIFDPLLAKALGFHPTRVHYALLTCVTATIVLSFEALGSILVVSMLVAPAAAAYLLHNRLVSMVLTAVILGVISAVVGYGGALTFNSSVAGMMSVVAGLVCVLAALLAPQRGIVPALWSRRVLQYRIVRDDILGLLFRWHEVASQRDAPPLTGKEILEAIPHPALTRLALRSLRAHGEVVRSLGASLRLSERGLVEARALVRSHRLWEAYLAKHLSLPADHLHAPSERAEHFIGRALARDIAQDVDSTEDPHGKLIP